MRPKWARNEMRMKDEKGFACVGLVMIGIVAIVLASISQGWALSVMWGWFVTPIFGIAPPSIPLAIGFSMVVGMLTRQDSGKKDSDSSTLWSGIAVAVLSPLFVLAIGAIVHAFAK